jgi:ribosomal-protein-alanine N-acetyltransferase
VIRPVRPEDCDELAALYAANRDFLAPFEPARPPEFFTGDGQRDRLARQLADETHPFVILESLQGCTIGYWVDSRRNGRGLATGAVGEVVTYAFDELDLHRVEAATLVDNVASQRVLEKNGFDRIGLARGFLRVAGDWRDFYLFQRIADDRR